MSTTQVFGIKGNNPLRYELVGEFENSHLGVRVVLEYFADMYDYNWVNPSRLIC